MAQPRSSKARSGGSGRSILLAVGGAAVVIAAAFVAMSVLGGGSDKQPAGSPSGASTSVSNAGTTAPAPAAVRAAGVEVAQQTIDLGRVPLDKTVDPSFTLKNVGSARASLGKAKIETLEGC